MLDSLVYLPGAILGILVAAIYCIIRYRSKRPPKVECVVSLLFRSVGIVAGALLIIGVFSPYVKTRLANMDWYVLIAGAVVLISSLNGVLREFQNE